MPAPKFLCQLVLLFSVILVGCSDNDNNEPLVPPIELPPEPVYLPVAEPMVALPPDIGVPILISTSFDFAEQGYVQEEC